MPSCEEAACCNVEVVKGAGGALDTTLELTFCTCMCKGLAESRQGRVFARPSFTVCACTACSSDGAGSNASGESRQVAAVMSVNGR